MELRRNSNKIVLRLRNVFVGSMKRKQLKDVIWSWIKLFNQLFFISDGSKLDDQTRNSMKKPRSWMICVNYDDKHNVSPLSWLAQTSPTLCHQKRWKPVQIYDGRFDQNSIKNKYIFIFLQDFRKNKSVTSLLLSKKTESLLKWIFGNADSFLESKTF